MIFMFFSYWISNLFIFVDKIRALPYGIAIISSKISVISGRIGERFNESEGSIA